MTDAKDERIKQLEDAILDIDAHAVALGEDADGFVAEGYVISIGSLHRALGLIGHSSPKKAWNVPIVEFPIGRAIRIMREKRDMKQQDLAAAIGLDSSAMSRIESGERAVKTEELGAIASALHVPAWALLGEHEPSYAYLRETLEELCDAAGIDHAHGGHDPGEPMRNFHIVNELKARLASRPKE